MCVATSCMCPLGSTSLFNCVYTRSGIASGRSSLTGFVEAVQCGSVCVYITRKLSRTVSIQSTSVNILLPTWLLGFMWYTLWLVVKTTDFGPGNIQMWPIRELYWVPKQEVYVFWFGFWGDHFNWVTCVVRSIVCITSSSKHRVSSLNSEWVL